MSRWRTWNRRVAVALCCAGLSVPAFNLALDPFSVLGTAEYLPQSSRVNERFLKVQHLLEHPGHADSFILGASTMGVFDPRFAARMTSGGRWYNLSFLGGTPVDALNALKVLRQHGHPIRQVMYGIDIFPFRKLEASRDVWRQGHPEIRGESALAYLTRFVFASSVSSGMERIAGSISPQPPRVRFDIKGTGRYELARWDNEIEIDHDAYMQRKFGAPNGEQTDAASGMTLIDARFAELAALKQWLCEEKIAAHFWLNPMHHRTRERIDDSTMSAFRAKVRAAVGEVPDYTRRTDISRDDRMFYEYQHFRPVVAERITTEVLSRGSGDRPLALRENPPSSL